MALFSWRRGWLEGIHAGPGPVKAGVPHKRCWSDLSHRQLENPG
jgi:hypothetical protein